MERLDLLHDSQQVVAHIPEVLGELVGDEGVVLVDELLDRLDEWHRRLMELQHLALEEVDAFQGSMSASRRP